MSDLKDLTPSVFGLVIAYLLPGLGALFAIAMFFEPAAVLLRAFNDAQSTVGLFFFVVVTSLLLGMQLAACRWIVFEKLVNKKDQLSPTVFRALRLPENAVSFRILIDEVYRYHQFFGAQVFVIPPLLLGINHRWGGDSLAYAIFLFTLGIVLEVITWAAATEGWRRYVSRARTMLEEGNHGDRILPGQE